MRQNLTNVKEIDIKDVEHFYVVGSTTKEGLLEGKSNVKLDLKKAASGGGGTSSEDAEKMYEALFGQTPYVFIMPEGEEEPALVPLYEIFSSTTDFEILNEGLLYYKSSTPIPKATAVEMEGGTTIIAFPYDMDIYMMEIPPEESEMPDTWYQPIAYDINLVGYTIPTVGNPTTVSGTLPDKKEIQALVSESAPFGKSLTEIFIWDDGKHAFIHYINDSTFHKLKQSDDNVIEWSFTGGIG